VGRISTANCELEATLMEVVTKAQTGWTVSISAKR
jgi:hypothetical protein